MDNFGGAEATSFERITVAIAGWLVGNTIVEWNTELINAAKMPYVQMYEY